MSSDELLIAVTKDSKDYRLVLMNAKKLMFCKNPYVLCDFAEYVELADTKEIMNILTNAMIRIGDIVHLYEMYFLMSERKAKNFNYNLVENLIKESQNPKLMSYTLAFTDVKDEYDMLASLYATKNAKWIKSLEEELDTNILPGYKENLEAAYDFDYFPTCLEKYGTKDISNLMELVIQENNPYLLNELADYMEYISMYKGIKCPSVHELDKPFLLSSVGEPLHQYEYAASIINSPKSHLTNMVIEEGIAKIIYYMYRYVEGVDKELLKQAIENTHDSGKYIKLVQ